MHKLSKKKQKTIFISIIVGVLVLSSILSLLYFNLKPQSSESYTLYDAYNNIVRLDIYKNLFTQQAITFSPTTVNPGDTITLNDKYTVPSSVGNECIYKLSVQVKDPNDNIAWSNSVSCLGSGPYGAGDTLTKSMSYTIPDSSSSIGTWKATTIYYTSSYGCNACPVSGGQLFDESTNTLSVVAKSGGGGNTCTPNFQCNDWSQCINGVQTRTCIDINTCGTGTNPYQTTQTCNGNSGGENNNTNQDQCIYIINDQCVTHTCDYTLGVNYDSELLCTQALNNTPDNSNLILYIIIAIVLIVFIILIFIIFKKFFKLK